MTKEELIHSIYINKANFYNIGDSGRINGTLLVELRRILEEWGKIQYNQALDDVIDNIEIDYELDGEYSDDDGNTGGYTCNHWVNRQSILNLKKK